MAKEKLSPPTDFRIKLSTGWWTVVMEPIHGWASPAQKVILITPCKETKERLDTIVHETLHATKWGLTEEEVQRIANDITAVLWRAGYRRENSRGKK
jgi:hypothetical protein